MTHCVVPAQQLLQRFYYSLSPSLTCCDSRRPTGSRLPSRRTEQSSTNRPASDSIETTHNIRWKQADGSISTDVLITDWTTVMESSKTCPWPQGSSRTFLKSVALVLASAPSPWLWSYAERSSKFSGACISKGHTSAVNNFSKVTMNETTQVPRLSDNLFWSHIVRSYLLTNQFCVLGRPTLDSQVLDLDTCVHDFTVEQKDF